MIGIIMAAPPRGVPLSPVSIAALPALTKLREACEAEGHRFLERAGPADAADLAVALWDFGSIAVRPRWLKSTTRTIAWSLESPLVAHRAYHRLPEIARTSDRVLGFPGVASLLAGSKEGFTGLYWPNDRIVKDPPGGWSDRRFAVMINSNKNVDSLRGQVSLRDPYRSARRLAASALASTYRFRGAWQAPNFYRERLRMIEAFAERDDFDLWGVGWDRPVTGASRSIQRCVAASYRGVSDDKIAALSRYRFALCIENTRFPGYISEKLFDAFFAGTIPIYLGAPDVSDYVPEEAFISADDFDDLVSLRDHLSAMTESEARERLDAARAFLGSPALDVFTEERFVFTFIGAIRSVVGETHA